jgi:N-acetyl-gamma-glutamyl-phosphate reductase
MIRATIAGGAGYTGGELLRLLLRHPEVRLCAVISQSQAGQPVWHTHPDLEGQTNLVFSETLGETPDVLFLCLEHGRSKVFMAENQLPSETRVIDLSQDFRIKNPAHAFVYGLPELNREAVRTARAVANPGCFATAIQLALLPLAAKGLLNNEIHVNAITGSTGAGQKPTETTHFSWRTNNISVYKAFDHQHLAEIRQSLGQAMPAFEAPLHFIPVRGDFTRGIFATVYTKVDGPLEQYEALYRQYYQNHPFTIVTQRNPALKEVVHTNRCVVHLEKHGDMLLIISMIDNLLKGASGQAVQNMNLMFGLEETAGLTLKSGVF